MTTTPIERLLAIMARLRDPDGGCPWDREQNFATIAPYTIEEAYEVADAIQRNAMGDLKDELGDLLFQVVFLSLLLEERGLGDLGTVAEACTAKLIRRHPHVFGPDAGKREMTKEEVAEQWQEIKRRERESRGE